MCTICGVLSAFKCCKIIFLGNLHCFVKNFFVAIYAFLCGEKLSQKLCLWGKKGQISSMHRGHFLSICNVLPILWEKYTQKFCQYLPIFMQ